MPRPYTLHYHASMTTEDWRLLADDERAVLERLLEVDFPGRDSVTAQLRGCLVRTWCAGHCPSVEFQVLPVHPAIPAHGSHHPLPVEGRGTNPADGIPFQILLFQRDGRLSEMEFVIYGEPMLEVPPPSSIEVSAGLV